MYGNCYDNCYNTPQGGSSTFIIPVVLFILLVVCFAGDRGARRDA